VRWSHIQDVSGGKNQQKVIFLVDRPLGKEGRDFGIILLIFATRLIIKVIAIAVSIISYHTYIVGRPIRKYNPLGVDL